jgi:hypothetical protein
LGTNPWKFGWPERISLSVAILAFGLFVSLNLQKRAEAQKLALQVQTPEETNEQSPKPPEVRSAGDEEFTRRCSDRQGRFGDH